MKKGNGYTLLIAILLTGLMLLLSACGSSGGRAGDASGGAGSANRASEQMSAASSQATAASSADMAAPGSAAVAYREAEAVNSGAPLPASHDGSAGASAPGPGLPSASAMDRKLIYNASVTMEVEDYGAAQTELFNLVPLSGGYLLNFSDTQTRYELGGNFVIKVPSQGFQSFLSNLEKLAKKPEEVQRSVWGEDVTEEYVDLTSRLKAQQAVEERLLSFMEKATNTENLLQYSNELARVQENIETIKGRMRYLDQNVAFSTVELRMYQRIGEREPEKSDLSVAQRAGKAMKDSGLAILALFEGLVVLLAGALPILLVLVIILTPLWMLYRKSRSQWAEARSRSERAGSYSTKIDTGQAENAPPGPKEGEDGETGGASGGEK